MGRIITTRALPAMLLAAAALAGEAPAPARPVPAATTASAQPEPAGDGKEERTSSRYHLADVEARIAMTAARFAMAKRQSDPFGLMQDPDLKPAAPQIVHTGPKLKNIPPTPFKDVVAAMQVTAVMPSQQRFLIGDRSFIRGNRFPILYRDKSVTVEVATVSAASITFLNVETKELAALDLGLLPPGMTRGSGGVAGPPGLERDNPAAPVKVEVESPPPDLSTSRSPSPPNAALR